MKSNDDQHRAILVRIAQRVMLERGLLPDFSNQVMNELAKLNTPANSSQQPVRDLRRLPWASIDNDDSLDLDQLTVAVQGSDVHNKLLVAVADVDELVRKETAIDEHAKHNTTSVYTAAVIFPMLPEKLSTDLTSLAYDQERLSIVIEMTVGSDGAVVNSDIYRALVLNHAKLAYNRVAEWLEGTISTPDDIARVPRLAKNLRLQDKLAQQMKHLRHTHGALTLQTIETSPVFDGNHITGLKVEQKNRARDIVEDFMIAANGAVARFLSSKGYPSIRRVVRTPKRWSRIVELAAEHGYQLTDTPDPKSLDEFLREQKLVDPLRFPDLSLTIIKLLGSGEYIAELPGDDVGGHFGLAVNDYTHSTAPNRRYSDLITQRLLKSAIIGNPLTYNISELIALARHCTMQEDVVHKVERQIEKSAAALLLRDRVGEEFNAIVTGAAPKGTWVRLLSIPVEGKLVKGYKNVDVGHRIKVRLVSTDVVAGYIDFARVT